MKSEKGGRLIQGKVVSIKMNKSAIVLVSRRVKHELYQKVITRTSKLHIHDEKNECQLGDIVQVRECPPVSKTKCWMLEKVIEKAG